MFEKGARRKTAAEKLSAKKLIEYLQSHKDPCYKFETKWSTAIEGKVEAIIWQSESAGLAYAQAGTVVIYDTTHNTSKFAHRY